uniref:Uncharacterized protein n=1 Tax=Meloidogyne enterolobii TaxID=390850 RepID=A0A6V7WJ88_MELEN|nr:unnamed protein product [Meloidogyne enterolobii]
MFDFLRPIQDPTLRIMIPEEILDRHQHHSHHGSASNSRNGNSGQCSSCFDESEEDDYGDNVGGGGMALTPPQIRRKFKAYTVMQRSGFQHTEYVQILTHLCKAEIFISAIYGIHGLYCPGFEQESAYQGTCHINVLSSLVGLFTGGMGLGAVHRTMLVCWLIMCIISSVANLLSVITTGVWLDHLSKLKSRTGLANGLSGLMLLGNVLVGVCFILTSVIICHYWASNSTRYQPVGRVAKRTLPRTHQGKRRSTKATNSLSTIGGNKNYPYTQNDGFYQNNSEFENKNDTNGQSCSSIREERIKNNSELNDNINIV